MFQMSIFCCVKTHLFKHFLKLCNRNKQQQSQSRIAASNYSAYEAVPSSLKPNHFRFGRASFIIIR